MKGQLPIEIVTKPSEEVERDFPRILAVLADALADQFIAQARTEVASKRGIDESRLKQEHKQITFADVGNIGSHPMFAEGCKS